MKTFIQSFRFVLILTILTCVVYPAAVTGVSKVFWGKKANGSFLEANGRVVGSELIGQNFSSPKYLHPRPSAAGKDGYDGTSSSGSNLGPTSQALSDAITERIKSARADHPANSGSVPADLVTASASGLDPHLSPDAADWQALRVAQARGVTEIAVREVIARHTEGRTLGIFGEPRVNVLLVNLDLDQSYPSQ